MSASRNFARPARFAAIAPYLWMAVFFLVPFFFILKISLSQTAISQPPYEPVFDLTQGLQGLKEAAAQLSAENFRLLVSDSLYVLSYLRSIVVAAISTLILVLLGYPDRLRHVAAVARLAGAGDAGGDRAVLDLVPDPHLCLDQHPAARRLAQRRAGLAEDRQRAARLAIDRHGDVYRHRLFVPAVHGAAVVCDAVEDGRRLCSRRPPILAARAARRFGWSPGRCHCPASAPAPCFASFRSPASS